MLTPKTEDGKVAEPTAKYIKNTSIHVKFNKRELTSEDEVEAYVEALKKAYLERIHQNLKITL